jgi:transposase
MSKKEKRVRRSFNEDFKRSAVDLVVKQGYSFKAAADSLNVSPRSLREWHEKFAPEPEPCSEDASIAELTAENKRLRKKLQMAEMEREILKKATAYFAKESK